MKKYTFSLLILFITLNIQSQQGWFWQNPLPQGSHLNSSYFFDQNTGYICGGYRTILYTTNGGTSVIKKYTGINDYLTSLYFIDQNTGMAVGNFGTFIRTTNSGNNWTKYTILNNQGYNCLKFVNQYTGFICGQYGTIGKTTNSGLNWQIINSGIVFHLSEIYFINQNTGFAVSTGGEILKTTNNGADWNISYESSNNFFTICFLNNNTGYAMGQNIVLKTTNEGGNWQSVNVFLGTIYTLSKIDSLSMIAAGNGKVYITTNSGISWNLSYNNSSLFSMNAIAVNENYYYVFGAAGSMFKTTNKGITWSELYSGSIKNINAIAFFDNNFGAASCFDGSILTTTNSGQNWIRKIIDTTYITNTLYDIVLKNSDEIFTVSQNRKVYRSTDFGVNWSFYNLAVESPHCIKFLNQNTGYITGDHILFKTTNNGVSWDSIYSSTFAITDFAIQDSLNIFFVTSHGTINKSSNSGDEFLEIASGYNRFSSITFIGNYGFACVDYGFVIRSSNGGNNWSSVFNNEDLYNLNDLYFVNTSIGYFVGVDYASHGLIYKTTNSGLNWFSLYSGTNNTLNTIFFTDQNTGYAAGSWGNIIKTTNGGGAPIGVEPVSNNVPVEYKLYQNYPNPFNPVTKIKFSIPQNSNSLPVNIYIYDVTGREIQSFSYDNLLPGTYSVDFDGTNLASGVYFYQLVSDDFTQTRKMVLIK